MQKRFTLVKAEQTESHSQIWRKPLQPKIQQKQERRTILARLTKNLKEWYHTYGSRAYVPSLQIDEAE
jgi:hypothetical protein